MNENTIILKTDQTVIDLLTNINTKLDNLLNKGTGVIDMPAPEIPKDIDVNKMVDGVVNKIEKAKETAVVGGGATKEDNPALDIAVKSIEDKLMTGELPSPLAATPKYTLEDVREKLTILARAGKQKEVKALVTKFGAEKISALDPKHFTEVMEEAELI
ncbi:hypothetical protein [Metaclostridioides mangenotii]|uniref:hypothetical protein n=1 Tax=Metaclostridioides mangenotii TaxID=1540 RepID=UPI0005710DFC|nr:hypothetical protein [Clostridioides mangenotii]